jgi:hypothetical protein
MSQSMAREIKDKNELEIYRRIVKRAIMHRKNSLYYRTQQGACVGDAS